MISSKSAKYLQIGLLKMLRFNQKQNQNQNQDNNLELLSKKNKRTESSFANYSPLL